MSNLKFTYLNPQNGTLVSKTPFNSTTRYTTPSICYSKNGTVNYIPLITPNGNITIGDKLYYYDSSDNITNKTIHCYYNNVEYVVPNKSSDLYDIPAGTYTPSAFKSLIESYMSVGVTRTCANSFTVTLNGVTTTIPAQSVIYYSSYTSGITARLVGFGYNPNSYKNYQQIDRSVTTMYCVWCNSTTGSFYQTYANYPITIGTGIRFN